MRALRLPSPHDPPASPLIHCATYQQSRLRTGTNARTLRLDLKHLSQRLLEGRRERPSEPGLARTASELRESRQPAPPSAAERRREGRAENARSVVTRPVAYRDVLLRRRVVDAWDFVHAVCRAWSPLRAMDQRGAARRKGRRRTSPAIVYRFWSDLSSTSALAEEAESKRTWP